MRITDTDARYRKKEFAKVLEQHEKEKKDKYLQNCLEMWKDFTPNFDFTVARLGMRRRGWPPTWPASGIVSILRWCIMLGLGWQSRWSMRTASSFVAAVIDNDPGAPSSPTGLP